MIFDSETIDDGRCRSGQSIQALLDGRCPHGRIDVGKAGLKSEQGLAVKSNRNA